MMHSRLLVVTLTALFATAGLVPLAPGAAIDELIAKAKKEGAIEFYAPGTLTPQGAQALGRAFNKKYGLNIKLNYNPSQNMARNIATVISQRAAGVAPDWDVMVATDAHHARLYLRKLHKTFDYDKLGVPPKVIQYNKGTVSFANQIVLPAYNKNLVAAKDVPRSWDDLLDPKWKGGKLAVSNATHHLARLAVGPWGEEKTERYIKALVKQDVNLGRMSEIYTRLLLGEVLVSLTLTDGFIARAKRKGAPIVHAEGIEPVISPAYQIGVLQGASHPNVGHLFAVFLATLEAQKIWEAYAGQTSAFIPGTHMYNYFQGKKAVFMTQDQAKRVAALAKKYGKMVGFK